MCLCQTTSLRWKLQLSSENHFYLFLHTCALPEHKTWTLVHNNDAVQWLIIKIKMFVTFHFYLLSFLLHCRYIFYVLSYLFKNRFAKNEYSESRMMDWINRDKKLWTLQTKWKSPLRISSVNVTKSAVSCGLLKAHSQVWDNFWQLKVLLKWWKMLFISP